MGAIPSADLGTRRTHSLGSLIMYIQPITVATDGSTHATGLTYVRGEWFNCTDAATTSFLAGADIGEASGTLTFNTGEASRAGNMHIITPELE